MTLGTLIFPFLITHGINNEQKNRSLYKSHSPILHGEELGKQATVTYLGHWQDGGTYVIMETQGRTILVKEASGESLRKVHI